jgi:serine/threonine protein kinase
LILDRLGRKGKEGTGGRQEWRPERPIAQTPSLSLPPLQELKQLSRPAVDFLQGVLEREPSRRPSAQEALQHPWVRDDSVAEDLPLGGSVVQVREQGRGMWGLKPLLMDAYGRHQVRVKGR